MRSFPPTGSTMLPPPASLGYPPAGFAPMHFATAPLPPRQYLHTPIIYWPLYPSPPVSPTGYYMQGPPGPPLPPHQSPGLQQQPQLIQTECLGLPTPMATAIQNMPPIDARLLEAIPRPISC